MDNILALEVSRVAVQYAIISEELDFLETGKIKTGIDTKEMLFDPIRDLVNEKRDQIVGVSMTLPGVIDRYKGIAYSGGVYTWVRDMNYADELSKHIGGLPVVIANNVKGAAMAEIGYGNLKGVQNGAMLMVSNTGVGGTIVVDGKIQDGHHFAAGELAYMRGDYRNRDDWDDMFGICCATDGLSRCVEKTSGKADLNMLRIFIKIQDGDEAVLKGVENYCDMLATFIYNIQCITDAERFVLGGAVSEEPLMLGMIQKAVDRKFNADRYGNIFKPELKDCCFHTNARMYGAMYNWRDVRAHQKAIENKL